jgi:N-formylmaleamate deformylase
MSCDPVLTAPRLADLSAVDASSRWVNAGEVTIHALDYGGERPALIVVPGITTPAIGWDFVVGDLLDLVRPIVVDVRGRGMSSRACNYRTADYTSDIEAIWSTLKLSEMVLLGHSMGARIVAAVAAEGQVPLAGSILVDPPMSGPSRGPYPTPIESFRRQLDLARAGTSAEDVAAFYPNWPIRELGLRARWLATCDAAAVEDTHASFEHEDFFETWPAVPAPSVLIYGRDSPVVTSAGAAEAATANSKASVVAVDHAGHMVPWDNLAGFIEVLRAALMNVFESKSAARAGP